MNRTFLTILFGVTAILATQAQTTQLCMVKEYHQSQPKTPLPGVKVTVSDAPTCISDSLGRISLRFRTLKPGDPVRVISVEKEGYEIFNKSSLEQWSVSLSQQPFVIVLVRSDYFKQLKSRLRQKVVISYRINYEKKKNELERLLQEGKLQEEEYRRKLNELEDRYDSQMKKIDSFFNHLADIDSSLIEQTGELIAKLEEEGKTDEVLATLEQFIQLY